MSAIARLIDKANLLGADISIWSSRQTKSWQVRVHRDEELRIICNGSSLEQACTACLKDLEEE